MTIVVTSLRGERSLDDLVGGIDSARRTPTDDPNLDVIVVVPAGTSSCVSPETDAGLAVAVIEAAPDLGVMRNAGIDRADGELVWLLDERAVVDARSLETHVTHDRSDAPLLTGPCRLPVGRADAFDADWWHADRELRLAEAGVVADPSDAAFHNVSAPRDVFARHGFTAGFHARGVEDLDLGVRLAEAGIVTAYRLEAGVGADERRSREDGDEREDGIDRARFLAAHPHGAGVVLAGEAGRLERSLRRLVGRRLPAGEAGLGLAAKLLDRVAGSMPSDQLAGQVRQMAATLSRYAGLATISRSDPVVRESLRTAATAGTKPMSRVGRFVTTNIADPLRAASLPLRVRHLHGPRSVRRGEHDLIAITVVRNGSFHVRAFLEHHRRLGIVHFVVLDNGSTDGTVDVLSAQPDVTLLSTSVPYKHYENLMKRYLVERFSAGRWNLFVDIDELFDYPTSDRLGLGGLLRYLDANGATAVVTQMLDLFPQEPLRDVPSDPPDDLASRYPYYDTSDISKRPYPYDTDPESTLVFHRGGIRRTVFGSENGLSKAALIKPDDGMQTFVDWHHVLHASFADVTCVLLHYPFVPTFAAKAEEAARTGRYGLGASHEYRAYWSVLEDRPLLGLYGPSSRRLHDVDQLVDEGFLQVSDRYRRWVEGHSSDRPRGAGR